MREEYNNIDLEVSSPLAPLLLHRAGTSFFSAFAHEAKMLAASPEATQSQMKS